MEYLTYEIERTIHYADTDAGKVVYYGRYLEYLEAGRMEYLSSIGCNPVEFHNEGIFFAVREIHATYKASARLGDRLKITTKISGHTRAYMNFHSTIETIAPNQFILKADVKCVCINDHGKLLSLPKLLVHCFNQPVQSDRS